MNSVLYYQKKKTAIGIPPVCIGEDAYPYADSEILIVADGLGGRGGYPHTKINKDILDKDLFYDIVFAPVFEAEVSPEFKEFTVNSFSEIFETKEYFFTNSLATKHSGYFASRFVTAISLYELKYNDSFKKDVLFERVRTCPEDKRAELVQEMGDTLAELVKEKLTAIADNVGFEIETSVVGAYLLPSTLTVAVMDDCGDHVDVIYLWAGDSRAYLWDRSGLAQITEDHEEGETMTNLITLTKPFRIEGRFVTVKTPCMLLNASDGCYKCVSFDSPFDLEYIFLRSISDTTDFDKSSEFLATQFSVLGRHDDSNTMALCTFGYDSYEDVKADVVARLGDIDKIVFARLPDIFQRNFAYELIQVEKKIAQSVVGVKDDLIRDDAVVDFVKTDLEGSTYLPYVRERDTLAAELNAGGACKRGAEECLREWIEEHWLAEPCMKKYSSAAERYHGMPLKTGYKNIYEQYSDTAEKVAAMSKEHARIVGEIATEFASASASLGVLLESLADIGQAHDFEYKTGAEDDCKSMKKVMSFIRDISDNTKLMLDYEKSANNLSYWQKHYVDADSAPIEEMTLGILAGSFSLSDIPLDSATLELIDELVRKDDEQDERMDAIQVEMDALADKYFMQYWNDNHERIISTIREKHPELIPESLLALMSDGVKALEVERDEIKKCCETREQIYAEYDIAYRRLYEESKL